MKLSIITINYNNKAGLEKTIASVMSQTWRDFEWIIIDGGSTDGSKEVIENLNTNPNANITYWCSEPDKGIYNAMNKGVAKSKGEYLNFMNSGDVFYENYTLAEFFNKTNCCADIIYGTWVFIHSNHESICRYKAPFDFYELYLRNICHQAMFIKATHLQKEGFDEKYRIVADYAKWIQLALQGCTFESVDCIICKHDMLGISYQMQELFYQEKEEMIKNIIPDGVLRSLQKLDFYEDDKNYRRINQILQNGGVTSKIFISLLDVVDKIAVVKQKLKK